MTSIKGMLLTILLVGFSLAAADTLKLKDGRVLSGYYQGGSPRAVKFEVNGKTEEFSVGGVVALEFGEVKTAAAPATEKQARAQTASGPVTVPAGTKVMVKLDKAVSTASHKKGSSFTAVLETDLVAGGVVAAKKGTQVYGKVLEARGGKRVGKQMILATFTAISINNQLVSIVTDNIGAEGGRGGAAKKIGAAALIGSGVDGSKGAKTGALVGAGLALLGPGKHIQSPAGTLIEMHLKQPLTLQ